MAQGCEYNCVGEGRREMKGVGWNGRLLDRGGVHLYFVCIGNTTKGMCRGMDMVGRDFGNCNHIFGYAFVYIMAKVKHCTRGNQE